MQTPTFVRAIKLRRYRRARVPPFVGATPVDPAGAGSASKTGECDNSRNHRAPDESRLRAQATDRSISLAATTATARARQRSSANTFDLQLVDLPAPGEDVAVDSDGRVLVGVADGRILRIGPTGAVEEIANTGGRP